MADMNVALVGKRAGAFVAGIRSVPGCAVVAVCEADPAALAALGERAGVPERARYLVYEDLLARTRADGVDAVVLGTPMPLHVPQAVAALAEGIHVLSEVTAAVAPKPIAATTGDPAAAGTPRDAAAIERHLAQCRQLVRAVRASQARSGAQYMLAENYCYRKDVVLVRALARAGLFGACYFAEGEYVHDVKHLHHLPDGSPTWRATWQVGRRGCTYGTHSLGPALEFFGPQARVVSVSCVGSGIHTDPEHPHDDTVLMLCRVQRTPDDTQGALVKVRLDMMSNRPHAMAYYALQGTRGCYEGSRAPGEPNRIWLGGESASDATARREWEPLDRFERYLPDDYASQLAEAARAGHGGGDYFVARDFLRALLEGRTPPIDVFRAMDYTVPGLISELSIARGGVPLAVPDLRTLRFAPGGAEDPSLRAGRR
jgi:predicted dehydrogenase